MDEDQKAFLVMALGSALLLIASRAHACAGDSLGQGRCGEAPVARWGIAPAAERSRMNCVASAARTLEQAALQWDFASNLQEIEWLQKAHDLLAGSLDGLGCDQRKVAVQIASEIDHLIVRDSDRFGPLVAPGSEPFGAPPSQSAQVAMFARQGINLARSVDFNPACRALEGMQAEGVPQANGRGALAVANPLRGASRELRDGNGWKDHQSNDDLSIAAWNRRGESLCSGATTKTNPTHAGKSSLVAELPPSRLRPSP